ncbi:hypothetical protein BM526_19520 (plasmid) [Alteromonas mediterranea]|uniref:hypothetical protein n=1 Tax=Alteromonas mediterranea TaxID=314275 RepID=UPI000903EFE9|nr:hypothetical protein [Alteromonas mediterranea]APE04160.1 hypothetical protein BM526_19520 [Alteromonas mediterranea]
MNDFILKYKITFDKLLAYLSFYYLISFYCAAAIPKNFFGLLVVVALVSVPFVLIPKVVKNAVFGIGGGTQKESESTAFK